MVTSTPERDLEEALITKLGTLKYEYRPDIRDRAALEANFRQKFESLNRVALTDGEFERLLEEIVTPDVLTARFVIIRGWCALMNMSCANFRFCCY